MHVHITYFYESSSMSLIFSPQELKIGLLILIEIRILSEINNW